MTDCIFLPFYSNKINNFLYNISFCGKLGVPTSPVLNFPDKNDLTVNLFKFKKALKTSKDIFTNNTLLIKKNENYLIPTLASFKTTFKYAIVIEDDFLMTKSFIDMIDCILKNEYNACLAVGVNSYDKGVISLYSQTLINIPIHSALYNIDYILNAMQKEIIIDKSEFPNFISNKNKDMLYNNLNNILSVKDKLSKKRLLDLKLFLYNLKNNIYTYVPKITLTPYNSGDSITNIPLLTHYLNTKEYNFKKLDYYLEDDILKLNKLMLNLNVNHDLLFSF